MDKRETLKHYFGHDDFRPGQETLVDALLAGRDVLGVMPTGAGKSMCYQIPALMLPGVTIVISPLISLMKDQVAALKSAGVPAAYLNSSLTPRQLDLATERAREGAYRIIYVAPERLETASFMRFAASAPIGLIAVDEAHCVSQWGQDFRPNYLRISSFVDSLPKRPAIGAFTATATERVREDIIRMLALRDPVTTTTGFDRPNLFFEVDQPKSKYEALRAILQTKTGESGIVYCATRKNVEEVTDKLTMAGFSVGRYHAGLSDEERMQSQEDFQYDRVQIMVATNAFGMGIDKSNVRFVIHYNMPKSMEAYYQEAGRAGRDGEAAECILLYSGQDIFTGRWMIEHGEPNAELSAAEQAKVRQQDLQRLSRMADFSQSAQCLRGEILRYFGQEAPLHCDGCSSCKGARYGFVNEIERPGRRRKADIYIYPDKPELLPMKPKKPAMGEEVQGEPDSLFEALRRCRLALSKQLHVPPYIVCDDKTLADMARRAPHTPDQLLDVHGMGVNKVGKYGRAFLDAIHAYEGKSGASAAAVRPAGRKHASAASTAKAAKKTQLAQSVTEQLRRGYLAGVSIPQLAAMSTLSEKQVTTVLRKLHLLPGSVPEIPEEPTIEPPQPARPKPVTHVSAEAANPPAPNAGKLWQSAELDQLRTAYLSGRSVKQLAEQYGRDAREVREQLMRMNLII